MPWSRSKVGCNLIVALIALRALDLRVASFDLHATKIKISLRTVNKSLKSHISVTLREIACA